MPKRNVPEGPGKRIALLSRTTPALRKQLEKAASMSGRSLGQEVELRLERSFDHEVAVDPNSRGLGEIVTAAAVHHQAEAGLIWAVDANFARYVFGRIVGELARVMRVPPSGELADLIDRKRAEQIDEWASSDSDVEGERVRRWPAADHSTILRKLATIRKWPPPLPQAVRFMSDADRTSTVGPFKDDPTEA